MTRIPAVSSDEASPLIKLSYWYAKRRFGEVPEPFAVTANHRKLFVAHVIAEIVAGKSSMVLPAPRYSDDERAAIAYADAMTATHPEVTDEQVADLERRFGRDGVVELTYQIALESLRSRMNSALGITEQGFSSGDACRVPWANQTRTRRPV